ncbi:hypothetical protein Tco_0667043 [Tanacetum coccineum]
MFMSLPVIERFDSVRAFSKLSDRIGSAMTSCNSFFNQLALISTSCNTDNRYAVSNGSGYAVLICWDEYAVFDRELDTPYPMEVDTPYSIVNQNRKRRFSAVEIRRIQLLDTAYWGFLGVGTMLDIFQNIILIPYLEYGVLILSGYGVLIFIPLWSLVSAGTDMPYLP